MDDNCLLWRLSYRGQRFKSLPPFVFRWYRGEKRAMEFAIPRIWCEPTDHSSKCYFCMVYPSKCWAGKKTSAFMYPDHPSLQFHTALSSLYPLHWRETSHPQKKAAEDPDYNFRGAAGQRNPYYPNERDINDLIRDLGLTKSNVELLTSRLKEWDLLDENVQLTSQRKSHRHFSNFFIHQDWICFCHNVSGLC
ncbi:uncharacterized protein LOC143246067 [Tachypleus tridentatus]|uniref:uncharacterized protein LOC143246067 n=1 Tax=Tachypleus tridentatus TaxID=6853 RepID=UPI003FD2B8E2